MTKKEFFDRSAEYYFLDDAKAAGAYCMENWKEEAAHILRVADEVCRQEFLFDLKWDMERTYEPVIFEKEIVWDYKPGDDPEFIFQFNRHRFFICLGQAYAMTGDEKYAKTFVSQMTDWIEKQPLTEESRGTTWRTIEAGLRGEYWCKAVCYFKDSPYLTDEAVDKFYNCMTVHADYIIDQHSILRRMSNWSVLEDHGLLMIGLTLPQSEKTKQYIKTALEHLTIEARLQIMPDGTQWEQSPMYHNEVFHCYLDVLLLCKRNQIPVADEITKRVYKMAYANAAWIKPDHHQFMNGDSDDTDIRDLLTAAAYFFRDPVLKYLAYDKIDFESIWDLGVGAVKEYETLEIKRPEGASRALTDSGNYYLRSDWSENANLLHFHCGTVGAGHGHSDKLHIDLVIQGEDVLMDAGRYNYVPGPKRFEFKDPTAHNTILVDGQFFSVCKDSWECSKLTAPVNQKHNFLEGCEFVQGGHLGYMDLDNGVYVNRKVIYIKPDIYVIADELYSGGEHSYEEYFHFNNLGKVTLSGNAAVYEGEKTRTEFYFITPEIQTRIFDTRISRNYNRTEDNKTIAVTKRKKGFTSFLTVIYGKKAGDMSPLKVSKVPVRSEFRNVIHPDSWAEALKLETKDKTYVVIICHQEVNTPTDQTEADGCMGYGNILVFDKNVETQVGNVLLW